MKPGIKARLGDVLETWEAYALDDSVYVPSTGLPNSDTEVSILPAIQKGGSTLEGKRRFLSIEEIRDVIESLEAQLHRRATESERCQTVLFLAVNDASFDREKLARTDLAKIAHRQKWSEEPFVLPGRTGDLTPAMFRESPVWVGDYCEGGFEPVSSFEPLPEDVDGVLVKVRLTTPTQVKLEGFVPGHSRHMIAVFAGDEVLVFNTWLGPWPETLERLNQLVPEAGGVFFPLRFECDFHYAGKPRIEGTFDFQKHVPFSMRLERLPSPVTEAAIRVAHPAPEWRVAIGRYPPGTKLRLQPPEAYVLDGAVRFSSKTESVVVDPTSRLVTQGDCPGSMTMEVEGDREATLVRCWRERLSAETP